MEGRSGAELSGHRKGPRWERVLLSETLQRFLPVLGVATSILVRSDGA